MPFAQRSFSQSRNGYHRHHQLDKFQLCHFYSLQYRVNSNGAWSPQITVNGNSTMLEFDTEHFLSIPDQGKMQCHQHQYGLGSGSL